ncbi:MAG TPA: argininosuccinate lyase, partial [Nitrospirae bacterium]|nr:argininosuccinate lyase [Nitrospirota bacterium]
KAAGSGFLTATDIAEYLVKKGMPFRDAHNVTGKIVRYCIDKNMTLTDLDLKNLKQFSKLISKDVFHYITVEASVNGKTSFGGTSRKTVLARIKEIKKGK